MRFLLDSGTTVNLLPQSLVDEMNLKIIQEDVKLNMYDGTALKTAGTVTAPVKHPLTGQRNS